MDKFFQLKERSTTIGTEITAGITTFLTMVYIVIVNPGILSQTGMNFHGVFFATIVSSVFATLIMALFANYPIVLAPGMGINAYFAFSVVAGGGIPWQTALGAVFVAGILFILISVTGLRYMLLNAIPDNLKHAIGTGVGLFIAFIGLQNAKIVVDSPATLVTIGKLSDPTPLLTITGLLISLALMIFNVRGFLFFGMLITSLIAWLSGMLHAPKAVVSLPQDIASTALKLDIGGVFEHGLYAVIFTFLLVTLFDTTGTMLAVTGKAGLLENGKFPKKPGAVLADASGMTLGSLLGTSPTTAYIESTAGVAAGARTGLSSLVVCILLALTLFFSPLVEVIAAVPAITAPALILVGFLMMGSVRHIDWNETAEAFPAFLIILTMPLTYSIANGIGIGFIMYPLLMLVRGKGKKVHPILYFFAVLFLIQLGFLVH